MSQGIHTMPKSTYAEFNQGLFNRSPKGPTFAIVAGWQEDRPPHCSSRASNDYNRNLFQAQYRISWINPRDACDDTRRPCLALQDASAVLRTLGKTVADWKALN